MSIGANMTGIPEEASRRIVIGPPLATNANGTLAWLLSEGDLASLRQQFGHVQNLASFPGGRITTFTGTQAAMTVGGQSPLNAKTGSVSNLLVGMQMDMTARIEFRSIRLVASFVSTDLSLSGSNAYSVVTNASVCASALCPNGGALVCNIPGTDQNHGTNFWIIISTTATDSKGVKIRL
jgi:hypothetical protein